MDYNPAEKGKLMLHRHEHVENAKSKTSINW